MKRILIGLMTATALTAAIPAVASAQTINERQNSLFNRIEAGVRSGQLNRNEAERLRTDFYALARLEDQYRATSPGLTNQERTDLNRRFDVLSSRIRMERSDRDDANRWGRNISQRVNMLSNQIERAVRSGWVSNREARTLRAEHRELAMFETRYRSGGYTVAERNDLDRRADRLERMLQADTGRNYGSGYGDGYNPYNGGYYR